MGLIDNIAAAADQLAAEGHPAAGPLNEIVAGVKAMEAGEAVSDGLG
jgi:hypothetical protein